VSWLDTIRLDPGYLGLVGLILIPSFIMVAALMAAAGATVADERESQQISGLFTLPVVAPFWFTYQLMSNPNGPLALAFSYFPLTAPVALTMRAGFTYIPPWQLALNLLVLVLFALGSLWLAGRAFRLGLLRYGQRVTWGELFGRQPARKEAGHG
jgi:ABC-2 type transport system permease protein